CSVDPLPNEQVFIELEKEVPTGVFSPCHSESSPPTPTLTPTSTPTSTPISTPIATPIPTPIPTPTPPTESPAGAASITTPRIIKLPTMCRYDANELKSIVRKVQLSSDSSSDSE